MLEIGGLQFPAAPFNGWYNSIEIVRDFVEDPKYGMLEVYTECKPFSDMVVGNGFTLEGHGKGTEVGHKQQPESMERQCFIGAEPRHSAKFPESWGDDSRPIHSF